MATGGVPCGSRGVEPGAVIHPLAIVDTSAKLAPTAEVGPWSFIGPGVEIGEETVIGPHVVVRGPSIIGARNRIFQFSSVGEDPSDRKYAGEPTTLHLGDENTIREGVTIHRGTIQGRSDTVIGNRCVFMPYVHVAHDAVVGDDCTLVNNAAIAGHVTVEAHAILGGYSLVHQYCRVGAHAFCGMGAVVTRDVPAFVTVVGNPARAKGINAEGLRRNGFAADRVAMLQRCFELLYASGDGEADVSRIECLSGADDAVACLLASLRSSKRGIVRRAVARHGK